jgi:hypothetical protein
VDGLRYRGARRAGGVGAVPVDQQVSLFDFADDPWALVTPGGAYTESPKVDSRMGWVLKHPLEYWAWGPLRQARN